MYKNSLLICIIFILIGCGYKETNNQSRDIAYISINKNNQQNYRLVVDDSEYQFSATQDILFKITNGTKNIKIYDENNKLIYQATKYVGSNNTIEINLQ